MSADRKAPSPGSSTRDLVKQATEKGLEAVGAGEAVRAATQLGTKAFRGLVTSKRFVKAVNDTFDEVDIDGSGTISKAELFVAILLLNHQVNKMPMVGRQEPPSRAEVDRVMMKHTQSGDLARDQFLAVCQELMEETMKGMGFRFVTITVLSPLMAMSARKGLDRTLCRLVPWIGKVLGYIPDSLFVPFAASLMSAFTPVLLDMARPAKGKAAHAGAAGEGTGDSDRRRKDSGTPFLYSVLAVLVAILVPVLLRIGWEAAFGGDVKDLLVRSKEQAMMLYAQLVQPILMAQATGGNNSGAAQSHSPQPASGAAAVTVQPPLMPPPPEIMAAAAA